MFVVRETFTAKPGKASALAALFKEAMPQMVKDVKVRVLTDYIGPFNTVVLETEAPDLGQFEQAMKEYMSKPEMRDKMKGYTDLYQEGRREVYKVI